MLSKTILIVDDQPETLRLFGEEVASQLEESTKENWTCVCISPTESFALLNTFKKGCVDCVFIDRLDAQKTNMREILKTLFTDQKVPTTPTSAWIISGQDMDVGNEENIKKRWSADLGNYFEVGGFLQKPLKPKEIVSLITNHRKAKVLCSPYSNCPLPIRVLNSDNIPIWVNTAWTWSMTLPKPIYDDHCTAVEYLHMLPQKKETGANKEKYHFDKYTIESWKIYSENNEGWIVQAAYKQFQYGDWLARTLYPIAIKQQLDALWQVVRHLGFSRMFFFKVRTNPGEVGFADLRYAFGEGLRSLNSEYGRKVGLQMTELSDNQSEREIWRVSLEGGLKKVLDRLNRNSLPHKFTYDLNSKKERKGQFEQLITFLRLNEVENWVKFPIIYSLNNDNNYKARGFLVFDRWGEENTSIKRTEITHRQHSFLSHCRTLGDLLQQDHITHLERVRQKASDFQQMTVHEIQGKAQFQAIRYFSDKLAEQALKISQSRLCVVAWCNPFGASSIIKGAAQSQDIGDISERDINAICKSVGDLVTSRSSPALASAIKTEANYYQQTYDETKEGYLRYPRVCLPLKIGPNVVGALAVIDDREHKFSLRDISALETLLSVCAPVYNAVAMEEAQSMREYAVRHEIGKYSLDALQCLEDYKQKISWNKLQPEHQQKLGATFWSLGLLSDSIVSFKARVFLDYQTKDRTKKFAPAESIGDLLFHAELVAINNLRDLKQYGSIPSSCQLVGDQQIYRFAVRSIIDNAFIHGDAGSEISIKFSIECKAKKKQNKSYLLLTVQNAGQMNQEALDKRFIMGGVVSTSSKDGLHVAVPALEKLTKLYDAVFNLENIAGNKVEAKLYWPVVKTESKI